MDLFHKLNDNDAFMVLFCETLEDIISTKSGYKVCINFTKNSSSIFFFIDGSSILQILPDKELQYTYASIASYQDEIKTTISIIEKQFLRNYRIDQIIEK